MTSHTPFTFVDEIAPDIPQFHTGDQRTDNYLKSMSYVDRTLCDFVEDLISKKYLVIIYGDHAPAIPWTRTSMTDQVEKKLGYRDASIIDEKGRLHEFTPLIIANSGKAQFQTPASVSVLDLYPTILGLAGWNASASFVGVSLCGSPSTIISDIPFRGFDYSRIEIHSLAERASHLNVLHSLSK